MNYIYIITNGRSAHIFGTFTDLKKLQTWMVNTTHKADTMSVWRFVDGDPDVKVVRIKWNTGRPIS